MRKTLAFIAILLLSATYNYAQKEKLIISEKNNNWQEARVFYVAAKEGRYSKVADKNVNTKKHPSLEALQWTWEGAAGEIRTLIKIDLSELPRNANISKAYLSLFIDPNSNFTKQNSGSVSQEFKIQRITSKWSPQNVTWNTQPDVTSKNQVIIPDNYKKLDKIDITQLIKDIQSKPQQSYGLMISCANNTYYNGIAFASSSNSNPELHPYLTIIYSVPGHSSTQNQNTNSANKENKIQTFDCDNNQNLVVYDSNLKLIINEKNISTNRLAEIISSLPAGTYLFQLTSKDFTITNFKITIDK